MIIERCNPERDSVPLLSYRFYEGLSRHVDITLVTHERNKAALEKIHPNRDIVYIPESSFTKKLYRVVDRLTKINGRIIYPLFDALVYPVYAEFNHKVYKKFKRAVLNGEYDIVHALTPINPRYPVKIIKSCQNTPFILGPLNGGVPYPSGFMKIAIKEFAYFNFLRWVGRMVIPGYRMTYRKADKILAGSTYTFSLIRKLFNPEDDRLSLFCENGLDSSFIRGNTHFAGTDKKTSTTIELLFSGRLVPWKGADLLIEALGGLDAALLKKIRLTIVGDGAERLHLENQARTLKIEKQIHFVGWIPQHETLKYYSRSDIFCFPSVKEFGGGVVLEALASGLPCIVIKNGGIGEYVTDKTGFRIEPVDRNYVVRELRRCIKKLVEDDRLRRSMSSHAIERAKEYEWSKKCGEMFDLYQKTYQKHSEKARRNGSEPPNALELQTNRSIANRPNHPT